MRQNDPIAPYINWEYRDDKRWAWPGYVQDGFISPGAIEANWEILEPGLDRDEVEELQMVRTMGLKLMSDSFAKDTDEASGTWVDDVVPPCVEEPDGPEGSVHIRIPSGHEDGEKLPVVFYIFGAGFMFDPFCFDRALIDYSNDHDCIVVAPNYRLHPNNKFPANINDLHAAYQWVLDHADEYNMDTDRIVVVGDSGGGWYGIGLSHRLKRYGIRPRGVVAVAPPMDDRGIGTSMAYSFRDEGLDGNSCMRVFESLLGATNVGNKAISPEAIPNHASIEDVKGMPPMAIHAMESDPCRDGALDYARKLLDAGVFCSLHVWGGTNHRAFTGLDVKWNEDPYVQRFYRERKEDIQGFIDFDFDRSWREEA